MNAQKNTFTPRASLAEIQQFFDKPIHEAAIALKMSEVELRKHCRYYELKMYVCEKQQHSTNLSQKVALSETKSI